ncbi:MAG: cyclic pyranopterin monophosphate synthase MoaC [Oligoflexia bacterium]|nr:cyclic pyranopterin monophosphate synthase MoaC [Oligoflexia bacterium]
MKNVKNVKLPSMIDISSKLPTQRVAIARAEVIIPNEVLKKITIERDKNNNPIEIICKKGAIFNTAIVAGILAIKNTPNIIPFCHPIQLNHAKINLTLQIPSSSKSHKKKAKIVIESTVKANDKTGVEMEALVGVNIAALTVYDMLKMYSQKIIIEKILLLKKTGGKHTFICVSSN